MCVANPEHNVTPVCKLTQQNVNILSEQGYCVDQAWDEDRSNVLEDEDFQSYEVTRTLLTLPAGAN